MLALSHNHQDVLRSTSGSYLGLGCRVPCPIVEVRTRPCKPCFVAAEVFLSCAPRRFGALRAAVTSAHAALAKCHSPGRAPDDCCFVLLQVIRSGQMHDHSSMAGRSACVRRAEAFLAGCHRRLHYQVQPAFMPPSSSRSNVH